MKTDPAIVPPPQVLELAEEEPVPGPQRLGVRAALIGIVLMWVGIFAIAAWLNPYKDGRVWLEETHRQLGAPSCHFKAATGLPCPSCGMTSSFALFIRGDILNSLRANFAGTLLASMGLAFIPWSLVSMGKGRWVLIDSFEDWVLRLVLLFVAVMLLRWAGMLAWLYIRG